MKITWECFDDVMKLIKIIIIEPILSGKAEKCFSRLNCIKTFKTQNGRWKFNCSCYVVSGERFYSPTIDLNESVIDKFAPKKERRMVFM